MDILKTAIETAKDNNISTVVVASTTGETASLLLDLVREEALRMIVVTHDEGRLPGERRFDENVRAKLLANNVTIYTHSPRMILLHKIIGRLGEALNIPSWYKDLRKIREQYGTGIKVCHIIIKMLTEGMVLSNGERVVAIAGTKRGADSIGVFLTGSHNRKPMLEKIITRGQ